MSPHPSSTAESLTFIADAAFERAKFLRKTGRQGIFVAKIQPPSLQRIIIKIEFQNIKVNLPAWRAPDGTIFLATLDLRENLLIDLGKSDLREWLAIEHIPANMIVEVMSF